MEELDNDREHDAALGETGFWGRRGAGCLFYARRTGRFLIGIRSDLVELPYTWGTWGGAVDAGCTPEETVRREVWEEAGYEEAFELVHVHTYRHPSGFVYENYLAVVEDEFEPVLDEETADFLWVSEGRWPSPLHFGLVDLLRSVGSLSERAAAALGLP